MLSMKNDAYSLFLEWLKDEVDSRGHGAQTEIANSVGISRNHLNDIIRSRKGASQKLQEKIAHYCGTDLHSILAGIPTSAPPPSPARIVYAESRPGDYRNLIEKVKTVLASNTPYRTALESNIEAFHLAVVTEARLDRIEQQLNRIISGDPVIKEPPPEKVVNRAGD